MSKLYLHYVPLVRIAGLVLVAYGMGACRLNVQPPDPDSSGKATAKKIDTSLLSGTPCPVPCWYGIKPGETSFDSAMEVVSKLPFVGEVLPYPENHQIQWSSSITQSGGGYIKFDDSNKVEEIAYSLEYKLTAQELIETHKEPDGLTIFSVGPQDFGEVRLIWLKKGLIPRIYVPGMDPSSYSKVPPVTPTTRIDGVILVQPIYDLNGFINNRQDYYYHWNNYQPLPK